MKAISSKLFLSFFFVLASLQISKAQHPKHQSGPLLGFVEQMEVGIWYQTNKPATVQIAYWKKDKPNEVFKSEIQKSVEATYFISKFRLSNLSYGTEYFYDILVDGKKASFNYPIKFKTQDLWQWRKPAPNFSAVLGSCLYINDPDYDRPGKGYGGEYEILESMADKNADIMLWTGDNLYYREPDFYSKVRLEYRNRHTRGIKEIQRLLATSANYSTWDDHDFGPNNSDRSYRLKDVALELFNDYWFNPTVSEREDKGIYFDFLYNDIDFIFTDNRYHRAANGLKDSTKDFFGKTQLTWIKERLLNSYAPFKIIIVGNQALNMNNPYEGFQEYKKEQEELLNFIKDQKINGVVFISGDRHHTELLKLQRDGMYPLYEFTNSPLTSGYNANLRDEENNPLRVEGTLVNTQRNFGQLKFSGEKNNRVLVMQTYSVKGELLWEHSINENELKFKKN